MEPLKKPFWDTLEQYGDRTALITKDGTSIAYEELLKQADEL